MFDTANVFELFTDKGQIGSGNANDNVPRNENVSKQTHSTEIMALIHEGSCECAKSELDLFTVPATQTSVESGLCVDYHPISSITGNAPIDFDVNVTGDDYLD